jgi:FKBP-type peptidyl-prolyl cis-trans isomerase
MNWTKVIAAAALAVVTAGVTLPQAARAAAPSSPTKVDAKKYKALPGGLKYYIIKPGKGAVAKDGQQVAVHYTGWLASNGQKFDSSLDRGQPFTFPLGGHQVIKGWDEGVKGMKVGEKRQLLIPPSMGYGAQGTPGGPIPGNATLIFDVELIGVK